MLISIDRSDRGRLAFILAPDENDAVPPLLELSFRGDHLNKVRSDRLALIAYLVAKPFLGNNLTLVGAEFPAYMTAGIKEEFGEHEFFIGPVDNYPKRILFGEARVQEWAFSATPQPRAEGPILVSRTPYGYNLTGIADAGQFALYTNLRFFCSFSGITASDRERAVLATMICDMFDGYQLDLGYEDSPELAGVVNLLSLVGISRAA